MEYGMLSSDVVTPRILAKLLTIDREDIDGLRVNFENRWSYVSLDHYDHFKGFIILTMLVVIKQRVENNRNRR
jgi:hypothetical protein